MGRTSILMFSDEQGAHIIHRMIDLWARNKVNKDLNAIKTLFHTLLQ